MIETKKSPARTGHKSNNFRPDYIPSARLLSCLDRVRETGAGKWQACCPAHDDKSPSLSIKEVADGTVLVKCWAGCTAAEITAAVGLDLRDLFPPRSYTHTPRKGGLTAAKRREYITLLRQESYLIRFAQGVMQSGGEITAEDAERVLIADQRVRKLRGLLHV